MKTNDKKTFGITKLIKTITNKPEKNANNKVSNVRPNHQPSWMYRNE